MCTGPEENRVNSMGWLSEDEEGRREVTKIDRIIGYFLWLVLALVVIYSCVLAWYAFQNVIIEAWRDLVRYFR